MSYNNIEDGVCEHLKPLDPPCEDCLRTRRMLATMIVPAFCDCPPGECLSRDRNALGTTVTRCRAEAHTG